MITRKSLSPGFLFLILVTFLLLSPACKTDDPAIDDPETPEDPTPPPTMVSWYVAPGGDNNAAGSLSAPFRTIARALESCAPGEAVVLRAGTYTEAVRIRNPRITLMGYGGETAIIQLPVDNEDLDICVDFDVDSSGGSLKNLEIIGGYYYAVAFETRWDWGEADRGGASDMLVENCRIHHSGRDCIKIKPGCDRVTIRDCEIHHSGAGYPASTPEDDKNAEGIDNVNGDQMTVTRCTIHDIASTGIYFKGGATSCLVERCRISACGAGGVMIGFDTSPEYFDLTVNSEYYEAIDGTVKNCMISDTGYAGIGLYAAKGCSVLSNTLVDTARKGHAPLYFGVTFQDWEPEAGRPASISPRLINNLVLQRQGYSPTVLFIRHSEELGGLSSLQGMPTMSNNLYFSPGGPAGFSDQRPGSYIMDASLAAWQNHSASDASSLETEPRLTADFHLEAASPAIERGTSLNEVTDDFDGEPRSNPPDIGADENAG